MSKYNKKVLIVEDEVAMSDAMADKFTKAGFEVIVANDGEEGLKAFNEHHPDIALLDIIMPKMDGISLLAKIREDKKGADIPIIMLSNLNDADNVAEVSKYKVYDYLVKTDWRLDDVADLIKKKLNITD